MRYKPYHSPKIVCPSPFKIASPSVMVFVLVLVLVLVLRGSRCRSAGERSPFHFFTNFVVQS